MKKNVDDLIKEIKYEKQNAIENGIIRKEKPQSEINEKDNLLYICFYDAFLRLFPLER